MPTFRFCNIRTGRFAEATMNDNVFDQRDVDDEACRCSTVALADGCDGKYLVLDYGTFCRALDFDPWLPVLFAPHFHPIHVVFTSP